MKKTLLTVGVLMILATVLPADEKVASLLSPPYFTSLDEAVAANTGGRDILVDFYTDW